MVARTLRTLTKGLQRECQVLPSFQEQGDIEKTNSELFHFVAAISVQERAGNWIKLTGTWQPMLS
jgi:hypothetical protein